MAKKLGKVTLRNTYSVSLDTAGDYRVTYKTTRGASYSQDVAANVVGYVQHWYGGMTVTVADAIDLLQHAPKSLKIPYYGGHKLQYYAQDALVILVATGRAHHSQHLKRFEYTIFAAPKPRGRTRNKKTTGTGKRRALSKILPSS